MRLDNNLGSRRTVENTYELQRILKLPRRQADGGEYVDALTNFLKTPAGKWRLKPAQAQALYDMGMQGGLFGPLRVGAGKTLITLLAPLMLEAKRPVLLLPAALIDKTEKERKEYSQHWRIPTSTRLISYEMLGRVQGANLLSFYKPDLIIADESHKLKNKRAGVTRRVVRYFRENPTTKCVAVSGTVMKDSITDWAHILRWCLKQNAPVPVTEEELDSWASVLDDGTSLFQQNEPGALTLFSGGDESVEEVRRGFQRRLLETPGVVGSSGDQVACSLLIEGKVYPVNDVTESNFQILRDKWETPDGWRFSEAVAHWRHARELALGLHYIWTESAPPEWLEARRNWASFVRSVLSSSRTLDTELQVVNTIDADKLGTRWQEEGTELLAAWRDIKGNFVPNTVARWHDQSALEYCAKWMKTHKGIVWAEHILFAEALAKMTGLPYFGANGVDGLNRPIELVQGKHSVIASIAANSTGRNLQSWSDNLITSVPSNAPAMEQLLGRTHRDGQKADTVNVEIMLGCAEHFNGFEKARAAARMQFDTLGHEQKLGIADIVMPPLPFGGKRWVVARVKDD